jgi:hypothetical protein
MLEDIVIRNYRSLRNLTLPSLGRVNLIVGKNNGGKTTLLEAIRVFCARGNFSELNEIATARGEVGFLRRQSQEELLDTRLFASFFFDWKFPQKDSEHISIGTSDERHLVQLSRSWLVETQVESPGDDDDLPMRRRRFFSEFDAIEKAAEDDSVSEVLLVSTNIPPAHSNRRRRAWFDLSDDWSSTRLKRHADSFTTGIELTPCVLVPTRMLSNTEIGKLWDKVAATEFENDVTATLAVIDPRIERIAFISMPEDNFEQRRIGLVRLKDTATRIPLSSAGDGISRLLQIVLSLYGARNGILLIDEFENGLHHAVQRKIWDSIFYLAGKLNVQVFATTHSSDTLSAFTATAIDYTDHQGYLIHLATAIDGQNKGDVVATVYDESELNIAAHTQIELR